MTSAWSRPLSSLISMFAPSRMIFNAVWDFGMSRMAGTRRLVLHAAEVALSLSDWGGTLDFSVAPRRRRRLRRLATEVSYNSSERPRGRALGATGRQWAVASDPEPLPDRGSDRGHWGAGARRLGHGLDPLF